MVRCLPVLVCLTVCCAASGQVVRLKLKFPVGRAERTTFREEVNESFAMPGSSKPMAFTMREDFTLLTRVISSNSAGAAIRMTYEQIHTTSSFAGKSVPGADAATKQILGKS